MFGGKNLDVLYVTSASRDIGETESLKGELDGALFAIKGLGAKGLPEPAFRG
jgi:sugar lactone lactonase YvrE